MPPQTYGQRRSQHWSKCGFVCRILMLLAISGLIFFYVYGVVFMPFLDARKKHIASVKEAETYLKSQVCTNRAVQAELGSYGLQKCAASHEIAEKDVNKAAIDDVLRSLDLCKNGECVVMSFNIVTFSIVSVGIILVCTGVGVLLACAWVLYSLWQMWQTDYELPFVGSTRETVKRAMSRNREREQEDDYPAQRAENLAALPTEQYVNYTTPQPLAAQSKEQQWANYGTPAVAREKNHYD